MPCRDDGYPSEESELRARLDKTTRLLCDAYGLIEDEGLLSTLDGEARTWWQAHKEADRKRKQAEKKLADEERDRKAAVAKLSPRERRLLGIK